MITLKNGFKLDFVVSSGALGFDGKGYWFEQPFRWLGFIRPEEFTIITKTLTYKKRYGNLKWWCPWKSVKFIEGGVVNSVGLTNPGFHYWVDNYYSKLKYKTIVSINPFTPGEARMMAFDLDRLNIVAIELNLSCPNAQKPHSEIDIVNAVTETTKHPVIVKLGYGNYLNFIRNYKGTGIAAYDLINSVGWNVVFPNKESPIRPCSGVSGPIIRKYAREALARAKIVSKIPVISGGGIDSVKEVYARFVMGAGAVSFGTLFLQSVYDGVPWEVNEIVDVCRKEMK